MNTISQRQRAAHRSASVADFVCHSLEPRRMLSTVPAGFTEHTWGAGFNIGTAMAFAPDGRLFVCRQNGELRIIQNGQLLATPFTTVTTTNVGERGLESVAFDPNFNTNHFLYIYYTVPAPTGGSAHNRVSRLTADPNNPNVMLAGSEHVLLDLNNLSTATNHNGGAMHFGADGKLYISVGENANGANAQTFSNLLGKMLRMNADGTIPTDNPYYNTATGQNRLIWSLGLRNPFTFAIQPGTGRMFINDVGQSTWEEINEGVAHSNYGWSTIEGTRTTQTAPADYRDPLFAYGHVNGQTAITGGSFYNPPAANVDFPTQYRGKYFFADYGAGWIRYADPNNVAGTVADFATGASEPVDIQIGPDGALYYVQRSGNAGVYRIGVTDTAAPAVTSSAFLVGTSQRAQFTFNDYVGFSLDKSDFTIRNLTTSTNVPTSQYTVTFDPATNVATVHFTSTGPGGSLPDGDYQATLNAAGVNDGAGNVMTTNHVLNFFALAGDANRDKAVDLSDFTILATNFNKTGKQFGDGDFNYDGTVDLTDFSILAGSFNKTLPGAPASGVLLAAARPNNPFAPQGPAAPAPGTSFSNQPIDARSELPNLFDDQPVPA